MPCHVFVSGCFDLLHSGHVQFLQQAAELGQVTVALGSDATIHDIKGRLPICSQQERLYLVQALRCVDRAVISTGSGLLDFAAELRAAKPDIFVVNADGDHAAKRALCAELGIEYRVFARVPARGLPERTTTNLRAHRIGARIDLAGGWLDQPLVSRLHAGSVIVASIESHAGLVPRSGLATSTRRTAEQLWGIGFPPGDPIELAKVLFACENPPGTEPIAGSQDALGITLPGVSRLHYAGKYWPDQIERLEDHATLSWLEQHLYLVFLGDRPRDFDVLGIQQLSIEGAMRLAQAADHCWQAILQQDAAELGHAVTSTFRAQQALFPSVTSPALQSAMESLTRDCHGGKIAGAGGGGYALLVADACPPGALTVRIRRSTPVL